MEAFCGYCHDMTSRGIGRPNLIREPFQGKNQNRRPERVKADSVGFHPGVGRMKLPFVGSEEKRKTSWSGLMESAPRVCGPPWVKP